MTALPMDDIDQRLQARLAELRRREISEIGATPLAWLAVAPVWTDGLAAAAGFPTGSVPLSGFLELAERLGLVARGRESGMGATREQVAVLLQLAPFLNERQLDLALDRVAAILDSAVSSRALVQLTPHLPDRALARAVDVAREFAVAADRAAALAGLSRRLPAPDRAAIVEDAVAALPEVPDRALEAQVLLAVWPWLTNQRRTSLASHVIAELGTSTDNRAPALLQAFAPLLPPEMLTALAEALLGNAELSMRATVFAALAPELPEPYRTSFMSASLEAVGALTDPTLRSAAQSDIVYALTRTGRLDNALALTYSIEDEQVRSYALGVVANGLADAGRYLQAREIAGQLLGAAAGTDPALGVRLGSGVLRQLTRAEPTVEMEPLAAPLIQAAAGLGSDLAAVPVVAEAADALRPIDGAAAQQLLDQAVRTVRTMPDPVNRSEALLGIVARLSGPPREELLAEAAVAVDAVVEPRQRVRQLVALVPLLVKDRARVVEEVLRLIEPANADRTFWMPEAQRGDVLDRLRAARDPEWLVQTTAGVAARVGASLRQNVKARWYRPRRRTAGLAPPAMARWAQLGALISTEMSAADATTAVARELERLVGDSCDSGDTATAMAWAETGSLLAQSLGGEMESAALLAAGRVERQHRQMQDGRHLRDFLPREEQLQQFADLLSPSSTAWALHYVGMPGVGKTMLIRYITAEVAPVRQLSVARLDFDRLDPAYPLNLPGQLLLVFAQELQPHLTDPRQQDQLRELKARVVQLHEKIRDLPQPTDPHAIIASKEFQGALNAFNELLMMLQRQVVLILDTCEELAKLRPVGLQLPAIDMTFSILEGIHDNVPLVRVVFAGRRLLACDGADWPPGIGAASPLPARPKLRLHEIRGFTADEAEGYLSHTIGPRLTPALRAAILAESPESGRALGSGITPGEPARYSPFDLALYADWVRAVPGLSPADITSQRSDQYIEVRIISRLATSDIPRVLPAVALLGRFDAPLLRPAYDGGDTAFADLWRELTALEWVDYQPDETLGRVFLEVQHGLLVRLRRYYENENSQALAAARHRLAAGLAQLVENSSLDHLPLDYVDTAMRLLLPDDGSRLWPRLEQKIAMATRWDWAQGVTERLLGEGGAVADEAHPARAAVEATMCAALLHEQPKLNLGELWSDVMRHADWYPDLNHRAILRRRAALGQIAAERARENEASPVLAAEIASCLEPLDAGIGGLPEAEQLAAAGCAALDALLDRLDSGRSTPLPGPDAVAEWARSLAQAGMSNEVASFAWILAARVLSRARKPGTAEALRIALERVPEPAPLGQRQTWFDWHAPSSVRDRVRLEALRLDPGSAVDRRQCDEWRQEAMARADLVDAERLAAATLQLELDEALVSADRLTALEKVHRYLPERQATSEVHRATPPLFVVLAEGFAALPGGSDQALSLLERRSAAATGSGRDDPTVQAAQREKLQVMRDMRLAGIDAGLVARLAGSVDIDDANRALPLVALTENPASPTLPKGPRPEQAHLWWRSQPLHARAAISRAVEILTEVTRNQPDQRLAHEVKIALGERTYQISPGPTSEELSVGLDWVEAALLTGSYVFLAELDAAMWRWFDAHPGALDDHVRRLLRIWALGLAQGLPLPDDVGTLSAYTARVPHEIPSMDRFTQTLGNRRVAGLAMDEGELLALRLPRRALPLLNFASQLYQDAGDPLGELRAVVCAAAAATRALAGSPGSPAGIVWPALDDIRDAYERFAAACQTPSANSDDPAGQAVVPSWDDICSGGGPLGDLVPGLAPWLDGWAERLVLTVDFLRSAGRAPDRRPTIEALRYIGARYPDGPPMELTFGLAPDEEPVQPRHRRPWWRRILPWAVPIVIILVGVGVLGFIPYGARGSLEVIGTILSFLVVLAGLAIGGLVLLRSGLVLRRSVRSFLAARADVRLKIVAIQPEVGVSELANLHVLLRMRTHIPVLRVAWPPLRAGQLVTSDGIFRGSAIADTTAAAQPVPPAISGRLASLADNLRRRHATVSLDVDYSLSGVPWEALLTRAVTQLGRSSRGLRFARTTRPLTTAPVRKTRGGPLFLCPPEWLGLVQSAWSTPSVPGEPGGGSVTAVSAIHLVGIPIQTSAGPRLSAAGIEPSIARGTPAEVAVRATNLIDAARLPLGEQTLAIVQQEPAPAAARVATDRERWAALRAYAAEVFAAGAGAVVFIPTLTPATMRDVLVPLTRAARRPMNQRQLLDALARVRSRIDADIAAEVTAFVAGSQFGGTNVKRSMRKEEREWGGSVAGPAAG